MQNGAGIPFLEFKTHKARQDRERREIGEAWHANDLVFCRENYQRMKSISW